VKPGALALALLIAAVPAGAGPAGPALVGKGLISTPANEFGGTINPDGTSIYFSRSVPRSYMYAIFVSHKSPAGEWQEPSVVPFSGHGRDFDPVLSPDGKRMVFISDRSTAPGIPKHDYDVYMVEALADGGWSAPERLPAPVNTVKSPEDRSFNNNEWFASVRNDGSLWVASDGYEPGGKMQIYRLERRGDQYLPPANAGAMINGDGLASGEPIESPDGRFLLFAGYGRKGGFGDWDIYSSARGADGQWGQPENLGPEVNSSARDYSPRLDPDGHTLNFTSERNFTTGRTKRVTWPDLRDGAAGLMNGNGNIYEVDLCELKLCSITC